MKIINGARQSGKTTKCIELLQKDPRRILLTFSKREEDRLREKYPELEDRIMYWETYRQKILGRRGVEEESLRPVVDNADYILEQVIGDWVEVGTFNQEVIKLRQI
jgi:hypothetical protein